MSGLSTFSLAFKSTLDKVAFDLASSLAIDYIDLDDTTRTAQALSESTPALVLEYGTLEETPKDPLYSGVFHIGARTSDDPSNYKILALAGAVSEMFPQGGRILIHEEFEATQGPLVGILVPGQVGLVQQTYDTLSGFRMIAVPFMAQRLLI